MSVVGGVVWWVVFGALLGWAAAWWQGRSTQRLLAEPVVRVVERRMDNPGHVARIAVLEREAESLGAQVATIPALQARIDELTAMPPTVVEKVVEKVLTRTVDRVVEKPVDRVVEVTVERVVDRPVPDAAAIAERDAALRAERNRVEHLRGLAAVLTDRLVSAQTLPAPEAPVGSDAARTGREPSIAAADAMRRLQARIEHLESLAAVLSARLDDAAVSAAADHR